VCHEFDRRRGDDLIVPFAEKLWQFQDLQINMTLK